VKVEKGGRGKAHKEDGERLERMQGREVARMERVRTGGKKFNKDGQFRPARPYMDYYKDDWTDTTVLYVVIPLRCRGTRKVKGTQSFCSH
jgi:hypothetical protein